MSWKRYQHNPANLDLDVENAEDVPRVLERAAITFYRDAEGMQLRGGLRSTWEKVAVELSKSAERIDKILNTERRRRRH